MKRQLLILSLLTSAAAGAQITITQSDLTGTFTVLHQVNDSTPTVSVGSAGASQTWNMAALNTSYVDTLSFSDLASVPDNTTFPSSNLEIASRI